MSKKQPQTVVLDFDGVLHSYANAYDPLRLDGPEPGALEFVEGLLVAEYKLVVDSARANDGLGYLGLKRWLREYGFPLDRMHVNVGRGKPPAVAYVDDRAVPYDRTLSGGWDAVRAAVDWLAVQGPHSGATAA